MKGGTGTDQVIPVNFDEGWDHACLTHIACMMHACAGEERGGVERRVERREQRKGDARGPEACQGSASLSASGGLLDFTLRVGGGSRLPLSRTPRRAGGHKGEPAVTASRSASRGLGKGAAGLQMGWKRW